LSCWINSNDPQLPIAAIQNNLLPRVGATGAPRRNVVEGRLGRANDPRSRTGARDDRVDDQFRSGHLNLDNLIVTFTTNSTVNLRSFFRATTFSPVLEGGSRRRAGIHTRRY